MVNNVEEARISDSFIRRIIMREEQELNQQREMNQTSLNEEEQAAGDKGVEVKSAGELEQKRKLVDSMDQPDSFEY